MSISIELRNKHLFNIKKQLSDCLDLFTQTLSLLGKAEAYFLEVVWLMLEYKMTNIKRQITLEKRPISSSISHKFSSVT